MKGSWRPPMALPPCLIVVLVLSATACSIFDIHIPNPQSCELPENAGNPPCTDAGIDGAGLDGFEGCKRNEDCAGPTGVCDLGRTMTCVQCTTTDNPCAREMPICMADQCHKCTSHMQCTLSNVCLPDGSCADPVQAQVAYVRAGGTGNMCTQTSPCGTLEDGLKTNKPYVKVEIGTVADSKTTTIDGKTVTILADPGARLDRTTDGLILEVKNNGADVNIFDLEITGGSGVTTDAAISVPSGGAPKLTLTRVTVDGNQGVGISVSAGTLMVSQSTVRGNAGGGLSISGAQFDITNSFIVQNGSAVSLVGGLDFAQIPSSGTHRFDFNTVARNVGTDAVNTGVNCGTVAAAVTFNNNIIYANAVTGIGKQLGGSPMCFASYSDVGPDPAPGTTNINADPLFASVAQSDFHLMGTSPAKDVADPAATLSEDVDGDSRPQGARRDMGADEVRP